MAYLIGVDIGTSGTKTVLFDEAGKTIAQATIEYPMYQPENGWAEQHPTDWWDAVVGTLQKVIAESGIDTSDVRGIGLSGQMHGLVMLDRQDKVIRPAIIWCDQRTTAECDQITNLVGAERLIEITANPALTGFTASKILWVRNNEPQNYEKCVSILLPKDYIRLRLTGERATEASDASGMQLLDIGKRSWSDEVLTKLSIDKSLLAPVYESPEVTGAITQEIAELTGLKAGTPVVGGAGDNAAAAVGTGVVADGQSFTTIGSSGVVYAHTAEMHIDPKGRVHTFCCAVPGEWHVMGVTQGAGLSLKWFRDNFLESFSETAKAMGVSPYYLMDQAAGKIPIGSNRLLFLPYLMGERTPHLDPYARGVFYGLSGVHGKADMIRAIMEGVSYSLKDCLEVIKGMDIDVKTMRACGGGSGPFWRQMLADVYNCEVETTDSSQGPALGVALLAGAGTGVYGSVREACEAAIHTKSKNPPGAAASKDYQKFYDLFVRIYPQLKDTYKTLSTL
jgi:xylulokinase